MTIYNIHYNHIKPVSAFNLDDENELLACCHYSNIQPLLAKDNMYKSCKWNDEDEAFWQDNIKGKEYLPLYLPRGQKDLKTKLYHNIKMPQADKEKRKEYNRSYYIKTKTSTKNKIQII